jgi:hypothetical protein
MAMERLHELPLARDMVFEVASLPEKWHDGQPLPHSREWKFISLEKATKVIQSRDRGSQTFAFPRPTFFILLNGMKYFFVNEYEGLYHFKHCNNEYPEKIVRQAHQKNIYVEINEPNHITARNLGGDIVFEYTGHEDEKLNVKEYKHMLRRQLIQDDLCTNANKLKVVHHETLKEYKGAANMFMSTFKRRQTRHLHAQRRSRGQTVMTHFVRPLRLLPR